MPKFQPTGSGPDRGPVEAERWNPSDADQAARFGVMAHPGAGIGHIGKATVTPGQWLVKDENGRTSVLADAEFAARYQPEDAG